MNDQKTADVRVFSFGGGVQSTAVMALQVLNMLTEPYDVFLFAQVDEKAEPFTHAYFSQHLIPFVEKHGLNFVITQKKNRRGETVKLVDYIMSHETAQPLPMWTGDGKIMRRNCTSNFKIDVINKWIRTHYRNQYVDVGIGFSLDEKERCKNTANTWIDSYKSKKYSFWRRERYPLVELGLYRWDLPDLIKEVGLPLPPKSSCFFCPFRSRTDWVNLRREHPDLFKQAQDIENRLNEKIQRKKGETWYLHVNRRPLEEAVDDEPPSRDFETGGACDSGVCFT